MFEIIGGHAEHDLAEHLHEATVRVPGEARISALECQTTHGHIVESQVEDRVHHARHREDGTRAHADQERLLWIAKASASTLLERVEPLEDACPESIRPDPFGLHCIDAGLSCDGKTIGHRNSNALHLCDVGSLASEQVPHLGGSLGLVVDILLHALRLQRGRWLQPSQDCPGATLIPTRCLRRIIARTGCISDTIQNLGRRNADCQ